MKDYLKIIKNEKECLCGQPLIELHRVWERWWHLVMERQCRTGVPHQVLPVWKEDEKGADSTSVQRSIKNVLNCVKEKRSDTEHSQSALLTHVTVWYVYLWRPNEGDERVPDPLRVWWVRHVCPGGLLHNVLVVLLFGDGDRTQRTNAQWWRNVHLWKRRLGGWRGNWWGCGTREDI